MATARCTAHVVGALDTLFATPPIKKGKLSSVLIDNQSAALRTIHLRDDFTPDPSVGTPSPSAQTIEIGQWSVGAGLTAAVPETELKKKEVRGTLKCYADATDAACVITVDYNLE